MERYDKTISRFVNLNKGGVSQLKVKLLSWTNNVEESIIAFVSQTWGSTFSLDD